MSRCCRVIALAMFLVLTGRAAPVSTAAEAPIVSDLFTVRHAPTPVMATEVVDAKSGRPVHVWYFRTEVRNNHPFPLRILRFDFEEIGPDGQPRPDRDGRTFTTGEFTQWYTAADPVRGGWLEPGRTAADSTNWNRSMAPVPPRGRWYYVAADSSGREYRAEALVDLCPALPAEAPWAAATTGRRIPVDLHFEWEQDAPGQDLRPAVYQLRFDRLHPALSPWAVYAWTGADKPDLAAVAPGLYRLTFYACGFEPVSVAVILAADDVALTLTVRPRRAGAAGAGDEPPVAVDEAHVYLKDVWALQRLADRTIAALVEQEAAHRAGHDGDSEGFVFDWTALQRELAAAMDAAPHEATRTFAAWLAGSTGPVADRGAAERITSLLPPSSPLWATQPDIALRAAYACGRLLDRDLVTLLAETNPDRHVQAFAVAALALEARERGDEDTMDRLRARLDGEYADVRGIDHYRQRIATEARVRVGVPAPAFRARDLDSGREFSNADFAGRYLLVHFWSTTCGFCTAEMRSVHEAVDRYRERGLEIVSFSLDDKIEAVTTYRQGRWKLPWRQAVLVAGTDDPVARAFDVVGIPRLALIGPDGNIVAVGGALRGERLDTTLAALLPGE